MLLLLQAPAIILGAPRAKPKTVAQCSGVTLTGAYLAETAPGEGPGFLLVIANQTNQPIKLAKPVPTSAHWYAQSGQGPWLWRASSGSGGALADALREHGPLLAYPPAPVDPGPDRYLAVGAHGTLELVESMRSNPILRFRPGCQHCSNPQDERYRAVLAYAYLPGPELAGQGLLECGLRSGPIVMPPLE
jgi:hypothetical protein